MHFLTLRKIRLFFVVINKKKYNNIITKNRSKEHYEIMWQNINREKKKRRTLRLGIVSKNYIRINECVDYY